MHTTDPIVLPDADSGLQLIRWNAQGFDELRRRGLLHHDCEFELVEGLLLHREPRFDRHERVVAEVARRLEPCCPIGWTVGVDEELRLDDLDSVVSPDVALLSPSAPPRLVVEVSHSAPRLEGMEKERLYARAGVEEYWHIDLAWNVWRAHARPHADGFGYRASGPSDRPSLVGIEGFEPLSLDELLAAADERA
jgi:hypothetical protein